MHPPPYISMHHLPPLSQLHFIFNQARVFGFFIKKNYNMDSKMGEWEHNKLINELTQGWDLARQLQIQLNTTQSSSSSSSSSSHDQSLAVLSVQKIISSFEKTLSMLNFNSSSSTIQAPQLTGLMIESPPSLTGSPRSDQDSDRDVKDPQDPKDGSKKRYTCIYLFTS